MRVRRWISVLAALGVLVHAGAIVRHNAAMAGAALQYQALLTGLAQICHGGASATANALAPEELPYVPRPSDAENGCPICSGLAPAVALTGPESTVDFAHLPAAAAVPGETGGLAGVGYAVCPPARGPPVLA